MEAAGPSQVEIEVLRWFAEWIGYPDTSAGVLVSGGSAANMSALACARERLVGQMRGDLVAYVSDQAHSSLARAARVLGFRPEQVRVLPSDSTFRLRPQVLRAAIEADVHAGRTPLFVSASAGATNAGSIDPLAELAEVCRDLGVWLHADAAYGGFAALTERGRARLHGLERADSVTLDPHKWLYQPFECGCLLVRESEALRSAFEITPDYLKDAEVAEREVNFADPRAPADASLARAEALGLASLLRRRRVSRRDRPLTRPRGGGAPPRRRVRGPRASRRAVARSRLLQTPLRRRRRRRGARAPERCAARRARSQRHRSRVVDSAPGQVRNPPLHPESHDERRRCRVHARLSRAIGGGSSG